MILQFSTHQERIQAAFFIGLVMMAAGLTLSPFLMSVAQFWLVGVWIADGIVRKDFRQKWDCFTHNWVAVLLVSLYLLHLLGLAYTSDFQYAFKDMRVKLPLLVFPFVLSSMQPLDKKKFDCLLGIYVLSVFVATGFSFAAYMKHDYDDIRDISRFISHIRFCLNIVFCIFISAYYLVKRGFTWWTRFLLVVLIVWFVVQLSIFESLSGFVVLCAGVVVTLFYFLFRWNWGRKWAWLPLVALLSLAVVGGVRFYKLFSMLTRVEKVDFESLPKNTAMGNPYWHDTVYHIVEDGRYLGLYYCQLEMDQAWEQRSALPVKGNATNGANLEATLLRYLTSKGLRKDAEGVMALDEQDIRNIEQGIPNYNNWKHPGLQSRISSTLFEYNLYKKTNNPNGGSLSQRIEYTRASLSLIRKHFLFGVGTGDIPCAYQEAYRNLNSPLDMEYRHRAHNQYLSIFVGFGIVGLLLFLSVLLLPYCCCKRRRVYLYSIFLCIILVSMFAEDTIETQAGVSLYAFFNALFLLAYPYAVQSEK